MFGEERKCGSQGRSRHLVADGYSRHIWSFTLPLYIPVTANGRPACKSLHDQDGSLLAAALVIKGSFRSGGRRVDSISSAGGIAKEGLHGFARGLQEGLTHEVEVVQELVRHPHHVAAALPRPPTLPQVPPPQPTP